MGRLFLILLCILPGLARAQDFPNRAPPESAQEMQLSFAPVVKRVAPAVVNIYTKRVVTQKVSPFHGDPFLEQFFGNSFGSIPRQRVENALGSGVIVDEGGLIMTNAHVIAEADDITVVLPDGREFAAEKKVVDTPSDLAVLKIDTGGEVLPHVQLRPSESLEVGDLVLAVGNPFGVGQTVTSGIVSALARSTLNISDFNFFIQTDAAINPGNSGGPLVAMDGSVVGINSAIYSRGGGSLGIGFAIPSEMAATVLAAAQNGQGGGARGIARPWLGITVQEITSDIAASLAFDRPYGVLVAALHEASPARKAGVKTGDVVLAVNGKEIRHPADMKFRMATTPIGQNAVFTVLQNGVEKTLQVAAIAPPDTPPRDQTSLSGAFPFNGATVANLNPAVAAETGIREQSGVAVMSVRPGTKAARIIAAGDVIVGVNGTAVHDVAELKRLLHSNPDAAWQLLLSRGGLQRQVLVR